MNIRKINAQIKEELKKHQKPFDNEENFEYFIEQLYNYLKNENYSDEQIKYFLIDLNKLLYNNNIKLENTLVSVTYIPSDFIIDNNMSILIIDNNLSEKTTKIYNILILKDSDNIIIRNKETQNLTYNEIRDFLRETNMDDD